MDIFINQEKKTILEHSSLLDVLKSLNLHEKMGIAIAINEQIITKNEWQTTPLFSQQKITIIEAIQGG